MRKILQMLMHNVGLKLLALFFAIGLWLYVLNVEDPEITRSFTVEVTFENTETLTDVGKNFEVLDSSETIRVTVSAQRSIIEELTSSDFSAVVDLSDLTSSQMDGEQTLEVYVSLSRYSSRTTIVSDTRYATISIEDELSKEISVSAVTSGSPADGYAVGSLRLLPDSVTVKGVTSLVEEVSYGIVNVDVAGLEENQTISCEIVFYDENGSLLDMDELTVSYSSVSVYVEIDTVKTIALTVSETGTPADGYRVSGIAVSASEITVQGEADALEDLDSLRITGDALDVSGLTEDLTVSIDPADYLPYGVSMYEDTEIEITISIEEYESVTLEIPTDEIEITGLSDGLTASFASDTVSVTLSVPVSMSSSISADSIALTADLSGKSAGTYTILLKSETADGIYLSGTLSTSVVIAEE